MGHKQTWSVGFDQFAPLASRATSRAEQSHASRCRVTAPVVVRASAAHITLAGSIRTGGSAAVSSAAIMVSSFAITSRENGPTCT